MEDCQPKVPTFTFTFTLPAKGSDFHSFLIQDSILDPRLRTHSPISDSQFWIHSFIINQRNCVWILELLLLHCNLRLRTSSPQGQDQRSGAGILDPWSLITDPWSWIVDPWSLISFVFVFTLDLILWISLSLFSPLTAGPPHSNPISHFDQICSHFFSTYWYCRTNPLKSYRTWSDFFSTYLYCRTSSFKSYRTLTWSGCRSAVCP